MPLAAGARLGPYEILSALGAGGMGEVYRARDTKLGRDVALKILPELFAADPDRLARFQREAQVLASLNHPHIAAIHGLEESNGVRALVLELVEGPTLADRIAHGPMPIDEALPVARQIAEALEAAHEQGIIHRDLKPANIKLRPDGVVKVLDFGLAKALEPMSGVSADVTASPTITSPAMTGMGVILGTAAYMSPEQAKGRPADKRSDVWAFGCILYEVLTGTRAFDGENVSDTLAGVLRGEPDWSALPANVPPSIRTLVKGCLDKDRRARISDIAVTRYVMNDAASGVHVAGAPSVEVRHRGWQRALPWAVAAGVLAAALMLVIALWAPWRASRPADQPLMRLDVDLGPEISLPAQGATRNSVIISPDGTRLVYVATVSGGPPRLFTRGLDQLQATQLPGPEGIIEAFFSPDGQWVGFAARTTLNKISVDGGAVVPLGDIQVFAGASWGEDDTIVVADFFKGLVRIPSGGGAPTKVTELANGELGHALPHILPGGNAVLYVAYTTEDVDTATIEVVSLGDHRRKILVRGGTSPRYLPSGHLVYGNKGTLFAIPFDLDRLETRGTAVPVVDGV